MDLQSTSRAITRARKRFAHATRQLAEAESEKAKHRHDRRARNAMRLLREAERDYAEIALTDA